METQELRDRISQYFYNLYKEEPLMVRSPGRINLIGEHTDYNDGFVLPGAIDKEMIVAIGPRTDGMIHLVALDQNGQTVVFYPGEWQSSPLGWPDYIIGVVDQLEKAGSLTQNKIGGFNMVFGSTIPQGAGLSSSAALECAALFALDQLFDLELDKMEIALLAQAAENEFVGTKCGLMDQYASVYGIRDTLIKLDCRTKTHLTVPFRNDDLKMVLFDPHVKHSLASSAYNERRNQCEQGVRIIKKYVPGISHLRDVDQDMLDRYVRQADPLVYRRCRYVVSEMERVEHTCTALGQDDFAAVGTYMFETHKGLRDDYEVSCTELDLLVELAGMEPAILGSRIMGGGFGGCTLNLVPVDSLEDTIASVRERYRYETGVVPEAYVARLADGTSRIV